ncbi:hypothetical protein ABTY53_24315 [Streptomyces noursei]|uniref:hypothetical protein n=1 Tax=Streptomyces noursei TaxID=1971 RepID=UPI0033282D14
METTPTTSEPAEVPADSESSPTDATNGPEEQGDGQELDADALRAELKAVRAEAAKYRTKARETAEALKAARSPEEFQAVADRATGLETELYRERLARRYHLPDALAVRIAGAARRAAWAGAASIRRSRRPPAIRESWQPASRAPAGRQLHSSTKTKGSCPRP